MQGGKDISSPGAHVSRYEDASGVEAEDSFLCQGGANSFSSTLSLSVRVVGFGNTGHLRCFLSSLKT